MKAVVYTGFGHPNIVLQIKEIQKPIPSQRKKVIDYDFTRSYEQKTHG